MSLKIPNQSVHVLTAAECRAEAAKLEDELARCSAPGWRRWLEGEIAGWNRLADDRS